MLTKCYHRDGFSTICKIIKSSSADARSHGKCFSCSSLGLVASVWQFCCLLRFPLLWIMMENQIVCIFICHKMHIYAHINCQKGWQIHKQLMIIDVNCHLVCDRIGSMLKILMVPHTRKTNDKVITMPLLFSSITQSADFWKLEVLVWIFGKFLEIIIFLGGRCEILGNC